MDINKFDLNVHDIKRVADLIVSAQMGDGGDPRKSHSMVMDLIRAGNNFLGHENIRFSSAGEDITGLTIGYRGRGKDELRTLLRLLISLRLSEFASYLSFTANLIHGGFTPEIEDNEYYLSMLAVDERFRRKGIGSLLLDHTIRTAKDNDCKSVVLDVEESNEPAISLYRKFGFTPSAGCPLGNAGLPSAQLLTMELTLS
ncbi:MAG: GNAT family N-acetyltransferase [Thermodesulfobacteriota bacterium]